jgi:phage recombination protein Bet
MTDDPTGATGVAVVPAAVEAAIDETGRVFTAAQISLIRRTIAKGATDDELAVFLRITGKYGLDPLAREVWCIVETDERGNRLLDNQGNPRDPQIRPSRAGWRHIAQREPRCDGIRAVAVCANDEFEEELAEDGSVKIRHRRKHPRGELVGAYALVWRKDWRHPAYAWADWREYGRPNTRTEDGKPKGSPRAPWRRFPSAMIEKTAEVNALRQAFPLAGLSGDDATIDEDVADVSTPDVSTGADTPPGDATPPDSPASDAGGEDAAPDETPDAQSDEKGPDVGDVLGGSPADAGPDPLWPDEPAPPLTGDDPAAPE